MTAAPLSLHQIGIEGADVLTALHHGSFPPDTGERWGGSELSEVLRMPGVLGLVACRLDEPLGYAMVRFAADECELLSLGVLVQARRTGVARSLLAYLLGLCKNRAARQLFLEVREDNEAARAFYKDHGFKQIGRRPRYYQLADGGFRDAVTMACAPD
ncbi:hypothetical protein GCM10007972_06610 [Iodidimonas muriae]|uniref:N-acetyltransferase domain-containing protein n=1 Tax=Iodidimonas muriae TaxID=261467 RepID=A0ABQ2L971_9PROT|nr:GNAT family N-acetyltransferase [Iodidimonas muriae]GER05900.1 hypothetical protein JCM17843_02100 [Kordiimonadales bacterium JCM 17843]GGO07319.1 hypothetical protein GCM10007972_06610 [Iodidimonas muriae]